MHKILILCLTLVLVLSAKSHKSTATTSALLQHTQQLNYTFYYQHQFPLRDHYGVTLTLKEAGEWSLGQCRQQLESNLVKIQSVLQPLGLFANITAVSENYGTKIEIQWGLQIKAGNNSTLLAGLLDNLVELTKNNNTFVWDIFTYRVPEVDRESEQAKAKEGAQAKSNTICEQTLGLSLKQISIFEEVQDNIKENNKSVVGSLDQFEDQLEEYQVLQDYTYYKCQIICEKRHQIDQQAIEKTIAKKKVLDVPEENNTNINLPVTEVDSNIIINEYKLSKNGKKGIKKSKTDKTTKASKSKKK